MSKQYIHVKSDLFERVVFILLLAFSVAFASVYCFGTTATTGIYYPPSIDKAAKEGTPPATAVQGFDVSNISFGGLSFGMASVIYRQADGAVKIFLTNPNDSGADLLCEIKDADSEKTLFKSGRIKEGQYLERIRTKGGWQNVATPVKIYVYAIDSVTKYSKGTIEFETILQPW